MRANGKRDRETVLIYAAAVMTLLGTSTVILGLLTSDAPPADTWAAGAGWFTAAVTLYAAALVRDTLITTRRALDEAGRATTAAEGAILEQKRIGEAQVRAYLTATKLDLYVPMHIVREAPMTSGDWEEVFPSGPPGLFHLVIHFTNSGQSPALDVRLKSGEFEIAYAGKEARKYVVKPYHPNVHIVEGRPRTVPAGESASTLTTLTRASSTGDSWNNERVKIDGHVTLVWEDVFGTSWQVMSDVQDRIETPTEAHPTVEVQLRPGPQELSDGPTLSELNAMAKEGLRRLMETDIDELVATDPKNRP